MVSFISGCTPASSVIEATEEEQCISTPNYGGGVYSVGDVCNWRIEVSIYQTILNIPKQAKHTEPY